MTPYYSDDLVTLYQQRAGETTDERRKRLARERTRRYRARLAGAETVLQPRPKGYRQDPEHVAARIKTGPDHHAWAGDKVTKKVGRKRALRMYPNIGPCLRCGSLEAERHHVDEDTSNNDPSNIEPLCRGCHIAEHRSRRAEA